MAEISRLRQPTPGPAGPLCAAPAVLSPDTGKRDLWIAHGAGLAVLLVSLAHHPESSLALNWFDPPKRLAWGIFLMLGAVAAATGWRRRKGMPPLVLTGVALWMCVRTFFRPEPLREWPVLVNWMLPLLTFAMGWVLAGTAGRKFRFRILGGWLLGALAVQMALSLLQWGGLDPLFPLTTSSIAYRPGRMIGTIGYQNQLMEFALVAVAGIFLITRRVYVQATVLGLLGGWGMMTGNRGGLLAFCVAGGVWLLCSLRLRPAFFENKTWRFWFPPGILLTGLLAALTFSNGIRNRMFAPLSAMLESPAVASRIWMAKVANGMALERPLTGWGGGEYAYQYLVRLGNLLPEEKTHPVLQQVVYARETHNDLLQFRAEFGGVGLLLLTGLLVQVIRPLASRFRPGEKDAMETEPLLAAVWILVCMGVASLFNFTWQTSMASGTAGLCLGMLIGAPVKPGAIPRWMTSVSAGLWTLGVLAFLATVWTTDRINTRLPQWLESGALTEAEGAVPTWMHRERALLGGAVALDGDTASARDLLENANIGFRDPILWNNLGNVYAHLEEWSLAEQVYREWAASGIRHEEALSNLAVVLARQGRLDEAAEKLGRKLGLWPRPEAAELHRLMLWELQAGRPEKTIHAFATYQHALRADSQPRALLWNLYGAAYLRLGDHGRARAAFDRALELDPELESARRNRSRLEAEN